jgi:hypothetical protein
VNLNKLIKKELRSHRISKEKSHFSRKSLHFEQLAAHPRPNSMEAEQWGTTGIGLWWDLVGCLDHFGSMFEGRWEVFWDIFRKDWVHEYSSISRKLRLAASSHGSSCISN